MSVESIVQDLGRHEALARASVAALLERRAEVEASTAQLEGPAAVLEYIDYFCGVFQRAAEELGQMAAALSDGVRQAHVDALRQLASNSAAEQRRSVMFRDKWINKPLPFEAVRPLLTGISRTTREQIDALRSLTDTASVLEPLVVAAEEPRDKGLDRRELFNRLFRPPDEEAGS
jgi:hypothetical protein